MATPTAFPPPASSARWFTVVPPQVLVALLMTAVISVVVLAVSEIAATRIGKFRSDALALRNRASNVQSLRESVLLAESSQRGFMLTNDTRYLEPFRNAARMADKAAVDLQASTRETPDDSAMSTAIVALANRKLDEMRLTVSNIEQGRRDSAMDLLRSGIGIQTMEELIASSGAFEKAQLDLLKQRQVDVVDSLTQQRLGIALVVVLNLAFLAVLARLMAGQFRLQDQHREELQALAERLEHTVDDRTSQLESLSTHLQQSSEREKAQLARDLHDELGGILTSAKIDIAWVEGHSRSSDPELIPRLRRLASVLDEAVDMKRRVVENLRPSLLDHLGLGAALTWYVNETCANADLKVKLDTLRDGVAVPSETAIAIYRLVQEALTNTLRYAKATQVTISIDEEDEGLRVSVVDNGIGIQNFRPDNFSHGLAGMRHRTRALGGSFNLKTGPGQGTRIDAFFPIPKPAAALP